MLRLGMFTLLVQADSSDIKQARQLLQNLIQTNPKHAPGWIAAASLEGESTLLVIMEVLILVHAKKMVQARKIIAEGCEKCPTSEDVWFHAAELNVSHIC
jgi:pre-mRNA-processing factor 6